MRGLIDQVIDEVRVGRQATELLVRPLGGQQFDLVIDTQRRVLTTLIVRRIRHRCFISGAADWLLSDRRPSKGWTKPPAMIRQMLELVELASGQPADTRGVAAVDPILLQEASRRLPGGQRYVGLAPGAGGKHKCWPLDRFIALARQQIEAGRRPVFFVGPEERSWETGLQAGVPDAVFPLSDDTGHRSPSPWPPGWP